MSRAERCSVKWCDEAGKHDLHRKYVASQPAWREKSLIGINVAQRVGRQAFVEVTVTTSRAALVVILLDAAQAVPVGDAILIAAAQASGLGVRA